MEGAGGGAENLLCEVRLREAGGPSQRGQAVAEALWEGVEDVFPLHLLLLLIL